MVLICWVRNPKSIKVFGVVNFFKHQFFALGLIEEAVLSKRILVLDLLPYALWFLGARDVCEGVEVFCVIVYVRVNSVVEDLSSNIVKANSLSLS